MSNKQQTAVEWLIGEIELGLSHKGMKSAFHKAKELEKQQIIDAHLTGLIYPLEMEATKQAEQYYNETFNQ
jgi:hypothetical protein